ncbi:hypothetical protein AVEN_227987-1 [Araneus ventricosus]|uniref:Uncharacterized protein n=1 Tax=Araneus ventricosus TaxID=182803 RepID=A0A4Y2LSE5_ARAVE|nr:hypothetical protein AVEN_227987-1 [Araneus ventricosus]
MAADVKGQNNCRLVIHNRPSGLNFLVDTGADISVVPPSFAERCKPKSLLNLLAANGAKTRNLYLNIGLRRIFPWSFIIADVSRPILGTDFLTHYGIVIDLKSKSLRDQQTTLTFTGKISTDNTSSITALKLSLNFNDLIREYNDIFDDVERSPIKDQSHNVTHVIQAESPPVGAKAQRLALDKLIAAKQEFQNLIHKGICSLSASCWASPLVMFTVDIKHISGKDNVVADALSRIESISTYPLAYENIASSQQDDEELDLLLKQPTSLTLHKLQIPNTDVMLYCDISMQILHCLPEVENRSPCAFTTRGVQSAKPAIFHINIDIIGPLPSLQGFTYRLTAIDRFSRWPEAMPLADIRAEPVAQALYSGWISRFGVPQRISTDRGSQFTSDVFHSLAKTSEYDSHTAAYHPQANGAIERWH